MRKVVMPQYFFGWYLFSCSVFSSQAMFDGYRLTGDGVTDCEREIVVDHETQLRDVCVGTGAIRSKRKLRKELCCILGGNRSVAKDIGSAD